MRRTAHILQNIGEHQLTVLTQREQLRLDTTRALPLPACLITYTLGWCYYNTTYLYAPRRLYRLVYAHLVRYRTGTTFYSTGMACYHARHPLPPHSHVTT